LKKFDRVYKHYDKFIEMFKFNKGEEIKEILNLQGEEVVLDIGGGTGRLADYISSDCKIVYILDESEGMLSKVKANGKVVPILGDGLNTDFENNSIDIVLMVDVFHHIENQKGLIQEAYRILKDNGKLLILDLEKKNAKIRMLRVFEFILFGKLYFKTSEEIQELIKDKFKIRNFIDNKYYFIIIGEKNV
jgi:ubiquinone/menaquinone biosynthesis C-methylase UbiE